MKPFYISGWYSLKKYLAIISIILILGSIYYYKNIQSENSPKENVSTLPSSFPALMEFSSTSCPACIKQKPIIEELKSEYKDRINITQIDVYDNEKLSNDYKITLIPTLIFFDSFGNQKYCSEGFMTKEQIISKFNEIGVR